MVIILFREELWGREKMSQVGEKRFLFHGWEIFTNGILTLGLSLVGSHLFLTPPILDIYLLYTPTSTFTVSSSFIFSVFFRNLRSVWKIVQKFCSFEIFYFCGVLLDGVHIFFGFLTVAYVTTWYTLYPNALVNETGPFVGN